jgi:TonB family protein
MKPTASFLVTALFGLILCVVCPISLQAVGGAPHKTDAELADAVTGNWEIPASKNISFRTAFFTFNKDGTCKAIGITNDRDSPRRVEVEVRWRVNQGYLIAEAMKTIPANRGIRTYLHLYDQIESVEDGKAKLRDEKGNREEMRRIDHLPSLPPLLTSEQTLKAKALAIYAPAPNYPKDAEGRHPEGKGIVVMEIDQQTGWVKSAKMEKSTGNKLLDDAALQAFSHWRFKPGTVRQVHSPITFTMATMGGARHRMAGAVISH